jgi:hypothetical protein
MCDFGYFSVLLLNSGRCFYADCNMYMYVYMHMYMQHSGLLCTQCS